MKKIKIFLASSSELKNDREQFEIFINRRNKLWVNKNIFLELIIWEDFLDAMSPTGLQEKYNQAIRECDLFVMLFETKVGKYTAEEFETAFGQFQATHKPFIFTYFKANRLPANDEDRESLENFLKKLDQLGHFCPRYRTIEGLREHFGNQLDKLAEMEFIQFEPEKAAAITIYGNVNTGDTYHIYGETRIPKNLTPPPFIPEVFLGRETELQTIAERLCENNRPLLLVNGEGGIGKTTLAAQYYHQYLHEYQHVA